MFVHFVALAMMAPAPVEAAATPAASTTNPNVKICENIPEIGRRLA